MEVLMQSLKLDLPEALLALGITLLLVVDLALMKRTPGRRGIAAAIALGTLSAAGLAAGWLVRSAAAPAPVFSAMAVVDPFSNYFKLLFLAAAAIVVLLSRASREVEDSRASEFHVLLLAMTLGLCLLSGATNALMIFLSLEFVSVTSYVLTAFSRRSKRSAEAALKYVLYGAMASAVMLFGFSYLYGLTGQLGIHAFGPPLAGLLGAGAPQKLIVSLAVIMVLTGFFYKIAAVPFHMWCPDVYEGAPTPVSALLSVGPKAAGFAVLIRFFGVALGFAALPWAALLGAIAAATMTLGNLAAIAQNNVKRLLAYSSIAHAGYMLAAVATGSAEGIAAVMLYLGIYLCMNLGAFLVVIAVRDNTGGREDVAAYSGLAQRNPLLAVTMTVFLLSLVGLPPLGGFVGKFFVFAALLKMAGFWYYALAVVGVLNSAVSLYYYARIIKAMFLTQPEPADAGALTVARSHSLLALALSAAVIVLGVYWIPLQTLAERSVLHLP